jgi:hypothetical protein
MQREKTAVRTALNWTIIMLLLLLPAACAVPQQGGAGGSLMGVKRGGQQSPSDAPPDYQANPQQDQRRK